MAFKKFKQYKSVYNEKLSPFPFLPCTQSSFPSPHFPQFHLLDKTTVTQFLFIVEKFYAFTNIYVRVILFFTT